MKKLVVIDSGNLQFKSIFAFRNNSAVPVTYTYLSMMFAYLKRIGVTLDDRIIVACDYGNWRKDIDPLYKQQRKALRESQEDADFWQEMFRAFNEFLPKIEQALPYEFYKIYKREADDIASCAVRYIDADEKVLISSDADWQMLCTIPNTKIFSPYTKKYKIVTNPEAVLAQKIKGDKSDNLLSVPQNEEEYNKRKMIVNLLELPEWVEAPIKDAIFKAVPKKLNISKIPFRTMQERLKKLYNL